MSGEFWREQVADAESEFEIALEKVKDPGLSWLGLITLGPGTEEQQKLQQEATQILKDLDGLLTRLADLK